ncbi:MAG: hypothetical protein IPJ19_01260 [Planctomycetes bacterium]|nr:hypothetical protein [Planctomycetota bacterium]
MPRLAPRTLVAWGLWAIPALCVASVALANLIHLRTAVPLPAASEAAPAPAPAPALPAFRPELESVEFLPTLHLRPGDALSYALRWVNRGTQPAARSETVFLHFESPKKGCAQLAFQQDHELRLSTDMWQPGELVLDGPRVVEIPYETPPGDYQIHVGLFDRDGTGARSYEKVIGRLRVDPAAPFSSEWSPEPAPQAELDAARAALRERLVEPVALQTPEWSFALDRSCGAFLLEDKRSGVMWSSNPDSQSFGRVRWKQGERSLDLAIDRFDSIVLEETQLVARRAFGPGGAQGSVEFRFARSPTTGGLRLACDAQPPAGWELETLTPLERAFTTSDADEGYTIAPNWLGQLQYAAGGLPRDRWYGGDDVSMALSGAVKQGSALLVAWLQRDASLVLHASLEHSPLVAGRRTQSLSVVLGPRARELEIVPLGAGSYVEIGKAYRAIAEQRGLRRTWAQKRSGQPELELLEGASEFRFSCFSRLAPGTRHNAGETGLERRETSFEEVERCVRHWHDDLGIERAQILVSGWNRGGYDNGLPDVLPANEESGGNAGLAHCAALVRELGYVFTLHDNYADMYPDAPSWDPACIVRGEKGELVRGGEWLGGRAWRVCGKSQLAFAQRNLPQLEELFHPQAVFLDSTLTCPLQHCFDAQHPMDWWQDQERRLELFRYARTTIGMLGLEGGREWAVPDADWFEGLLTQKTVHRRDWTIAPLFLLVYGDCVQMLPMQADRLRPRDARKLLDLLLCGQMPSAAFGAHAYFEDLVRGALPLVPELAAFHALGPNEFRLALKWKLGGDLHEDDSVFVHFTRPGAKNREGIVFQADHATAEPTSSWRAGETHQSGGQIVRVPYTESGEEQWEVRAGLARGGERRPLAAPDADDGMLTIGILRRENGMLVLEPATRSVDSTFARADGGWAEGLLAYDRMIKNACEILGPVNRRALAKGMTSHRFLRADRSVEESRFGDLVVTVNFGEAEYSAGEVTLPQYGFLVESPEFLAFHATRRAALEYPGGALFTLRAEQGSTLANARRIRVFHGFGAADVDLAGGRYAVPRERWIEISR